MTEFGWSRQQVTSGNAYSKLIVGPLFGYLAGWLIDRYGPRRLLLVGILMAGGALIGLGAISTLAGFYVFYLFNALGYVFGGPLPCQVLLSRWFTTSRGKAMGFAYLGIGVGGAVVPLLAVWLTSQFGWQRALQGGAPMLLCAWPLAWFVRDAPDGFAASAARANAEQPFDVRRLLRTPAFYLLLIRQHVLDRRRRRHDAEPEAVSEPRPSVRAGRGRADPVAGTALAASPAGC